RRVDVRLHASGETADFRLLQFAGNLPDRLELARAGNGKARLDGVDPELRQLAGDDDLLFRLHGSAGSLFAVAQGRVENADSPLGFGHLEPLLDGFNDV